MPCIENANGEGIKVELPLSVRKKEKESKKETGALRSIVCMLKRGYVGM